MSSAQPLPRSPARQESDANRHSHPYPIRTTSSSLLTRSNSTGSRHRPAIVSSISPASPALGRAQGRGHKYSKSATSIAPPPLPAPASPATQEPAELLDGSPARWRLKRSETLPSFFTRGESRKEDVPPNPKLWSSRHLAEYLSVALRPRNGGILPLPVIRDVTGFVVESKLTGRAFLRLTQGDLDEMGINQLWKESLLTASRTLRQNLVQGRIWGFGNSVPEEEDDAQVLQSLSSPNDSDRDKSGGGQSEGRAMHTRTRSGRVQTMVASLEGHNSSTDEGSMSASDNDEAIYSSNDDDSIELPRSPKGLTSEDDSSGYISAEQYSSPTSDSGEPSKTVGVATVSSDTAKAVKAISSSTTSLLQTPPPVYAVSVALEDTPVASEARVPALLLSLSKATQDSLSGENIDPDLSPGQHHIVDPLGSDDTMENLIANALEPRNGSWGAKAWEQAAELEEGSTSRRITDMIDDGAPPVRKGAHQRSVIGLFETPPPLPLPPHAKTETTTAAAPSAGDSTLNPVSVPSAPQHAALLDELMRRLEEVERRLDQMEVRESEWEKREQEIIELRRVIEEERSSATDGPSLIHPSNAIVMVDLTSPLPSDGSNVLENRKRTHHDASVDAVQDNLGSDKEVTDEPSASGLPSYVLLVSLGVFTVVARVIFKRLTGRRSN